MAINSPESNQVKNVGVPIRYRPPGNLNPLPTAPQHAQVTPPKHVEDLGLSPFTHLLPMLPLLNPHPLGRVKIHGVEVHSSLDGHSIHSATLRTVSLLTVIKLLLRRWVSSQSTPLGMQ